ncbi:MAG: hypothetical protein M1816_001073 [Peltula sp. TS41687]|nr:MAG: hypothetical protein M1816_001073 [Peltula sp. TS41687]
MSENDINGGDLNIQMRQIFQRTSAPRFPQRVLIHRQPLFRRLLATETRQWSTPLARHLAEAIKTTGPISLAYYMRQCLTSPDGGYYTSSKPDKDQFGQKGDFITSPEISQIFGELIGIWFVAEWMAQGKPAQGVELIELGPGRGTLMDDMLRTIRNFKEFASVIKAVRLVETSPALRDSQKRLLCADAPMKETSDGFQSSSKYSGLPITWTENIRHVPKGDANPVNFTRVCMLRAGLDRDMTPFIIAHEFFDALPIHVFQSVSTAQNGTSQAQGSSTFDPSRRPQWREMLVSPTPSSPNRKDDDPEFQVGLSKTSTPHSLLLPEISDRYKALKPQVGATIEIGPEAHSYAEEFARRIGGGNKAQETKPAPSGAALIIDYGPASTIPINSLRGIRAHQIVSPFSAPGLVDLSADVDFTALAEAALRASPNVEVYGPVEQGDFLQTMGIKERAEFLGNGIKAADVEKRKRLESGWRRLVERGGGGMGKIYKAMAIVPASGGKRRPVGFGGDVIS